MPRLNQKGAVQFIVLLIILIGIAGGVFLVTRGEPLKLFPQAKEDKVSGPIPNLPKPKPTKKPRPTSQPTPTPSPSPTAFNRVFITSTTYDGNLGGLSGADAKCQERSNAASLGGTWKAWLSDSNTSAGSRLSHSSLPYILLNGTLVANNWADLTSFKPDRSLLRHAIDVTELGTSFYPLVWTNTLYDGSIAPSITSCGNWQATTTGTTAYVGAPGIDDFLGPPWTSYVTRDCYRQAALYCFEQ